MTQVRANIWPSGICTSVRNAGHERPFNEEMASRVRALAQLIYVT